MSGYETVEIPQNHWLKKESPLLRAYKKGKLQILFSPGEPMDDPNFPQSDGAHLSISHPDRYPTWQEIYDARYTFMDSNQDAYMVLPKKSNYVNVHPNCFHIWMPVKRRIIDL